MNERSHPVLSPSTIHSSCIHFMAGLCSNKRRMNSRYTTKYHVRYLCMPIATRHGSPLVPAATTERQHLPWCILFCIETAIMYTHQSVSTHAMGGVQEKKLKVGISDDPRNETISSTRGTLKQLGLITSLPSIGNLVSAVNA